MPRWLVLLIFLAYLVPCLCLAGPYRHFISSDGTAYLSLARHWAAGRCDEAVNGYWGPLFPVLLSGLLLLGGSAYLASKVIALVAGLVVLFMMNRLGRRLDLPPALRAAACLAFVPLAVFFNCQSFLADFLFLAVLLVYLDLAAADRPSLPRGMLIGFMGGLCYLAKGFGLPYVLAHYYVLNSWRALRTPPGERGPAIRSFLAGLLAFAAVVAAWALPLSLKYGHPTTGTTAALHWAAIGDLQRGVLDLPHDVAGLIPPPGPNALSGWDDPTFYAMGYWRPWLSWENARFYAGHMLRSAAGILELHFIYVPLALYWPIGHLLFMFMFKYKIGASAQRPPRTLSPAARYLWFSLLLYVGGYLLVMHNPNWRYFGPSYVLVLLLGIAAIPEWGRWAPWGPAVSIIAALATTLASWRAPVADIVHYLPEARQFDSLARAAQTLHVTGGFAATGMWANSLRFAAYRREAEDDKIPVRFFGVQGRLDGDAFRRALAENGIGYVLVWKPAASSQTWMRDYERFDQTADPKIQVFRRRAPRSP